MFIKKEQHFNRYRFVLFLTQFTYILNSTIIFVLFSKHVTITFVFQFCIEKKIK